MSVNPFYRAEWISNPLVRVAAAFLLFFAITGIVVVFGRIVERVPWIVAFDSAVYQWINLGPHPDWLNTIVSPFNFNFLPWGGTFIPSFLYFVFLLGFVVILARHRKDVWWVVLGVVVALAANYILYKITHELVERDRPFWHLPNNLPELHRDIWKHWPTYPSGHVRDLALYATVLAGFARELRWPFVALTLWVAWTRLYLGAHYPTDVLAGLVLGVASGVSILILLFAVRDGLKRLPWKSKAKIATDV